MAKKRKQEDVELVVDEDDDDENLEAVPRAKAWVVPGDTVLCYGNYEPGGDIRTLFVAEAVCRMDFAEKCPKAGSSGMGWQLRLIEGRASGSAPHKIRKEKGVFYFLGDKDVKPFDAERKKIWKKFNTKNKSRVRVTKKKRRK